MVWTWESPVTIDVSICNSLNGDCFQSLLANMRIPSLWKCICMEIYKHSYVASWMVLFTIPNPNMMWIRSLLFLVYCLPVDDRKDKSKYFKISSTLCHCEKVRLSALSGSKHWVAWSLLEFCQHTKKTHKGLCKASCLCAPRAPFGWKGVMAPKIEITDEVEGISTPEE